MDQKFELYKILGEFLETKPWEVFKDHHFVAVEIPETKEMYYVTINQSEEETIELDINLLKGDLGLEYIRKYLDVKSELLDEMERSHFISISFEKKQGEWSEGYGLHYEDPTYDSYEAFGEPFIFMKTKGYTSEPLDETTLSDVLTVFEALTQVPIKNLKELKRITKNTTLETLIKKEGKWQKENRKVKLNYEKVKYSDLEIYPLLKRSESINEVWYLVSIYEDTLIKDERADGLYDVLPFEASVHILDPQGDPLNFNPFVGFEEEISTTKKVIVDTLKTFEVRPKQMVTNIKSLYMALKDFLKALEIEVIYKSDDPKIEEFVEYMIYDDDFDDDFIDEETFSNILMSHFLEAKDIALEDLDDLSEEKVEALIDELHNTVNTLMVSCDQELSTNPELKNLTDEELSDFVLDYIINGIHEQTKA